MRNAITAFMLSTALAGAAAAQEREGPAIAAVIDDQLADFTARDLDGAFDHASRTIRRIFGSAENFGAMVEQGYPMVWDNTGARYLALREQGDVWWQRVLLRDARGVPHLLEYKMIETPQGWRIDGVSLVAGPDVGV
ncbi:DUF4864 domain-containing protein [Limimaricola litoreus]|uniref:DUF4864 domain-containing protein n=1 Tax=Limimaricola litoreus TaxID=2955316 RepID=A0A9X2FSJ7_9RHOB|nr:DUF4864 domain-containing protein [Limimaricola litoreus]MCP1169344.1 DUF4864 domain-containing protein [Limimaricola litoreus]